MTRKSFYRAFRKIAPNFQWKIVSMGMIRGETNGNDITCGSFCPITALYKVRTGKTLTPGLYEHASDELGINPWDAKVIADGADDYKMNRAKTFARKALLRSIKTS